MYLCALHRKPSLRLIESPCDGFEEAQFESRLNGRLLLPRRPPRVQIAPERPVNEHRWHSRGATDAADKYVEHVIGVPEIAQSCIDSTSGNARARWWHGTHDLAHELRSTIPGLAENRSNDLLQLSSHSTPAYPSRSVTHSTFYRPSASS